MSKGRTDHLDGWRTSEEFRAIARKQGRINGERWKALPRCGAHARTTGLSCGQLAMKNGRCRLHGGATPAGRQWHRPKPAVSFEKTERKIADRLRAQKRKARRIAAMSAAERERYDQWHAAHAPGSKAMRAAERAGRNQAKGARKLFSKPVERPTDAAADDLAARRAALEARHSWLEIEIATQLKQGVFG